MAKHIKFASWAFAFDAILVSFTARLSFWLFFLCAIGILPKTVKRMPHFFCRFWGEQAEVKKWVNSRTQDDFFFGIIVCRVGKEMKRTTRKVMAK